MNSLISEQQVSRRKNTRELDSKPAAPEIITRNALTRTGEKPAKEKARSGQERTFLFRRNPKTGLGYDRAKRSSSDGESLGGIIDFPRSPRPRTALRKAPAADSSDRMEVTALGILFLGNALLFMALILFVLTSPGGFNRFLLSRSSLTTPVDVYSGPFHYGVQVASQSPNSDTQEIDPGLFAPLEVQEYKVEPGDTLGQIAIDHNLHMDTLISFNQISDVRRMQIGQVFRIPNRDGLLHTVVAGDSLSGLADSYGISLNSMLDANSMTSSEIQPGQTIFIPGARMDATDLKLVLGELFIYPTVGRFTSPFGYRPDPFTGVRRFHTGVDLANHIGTPVRASMAGTVVHVETQIGNYGKFIIIQHPKGFQTLYGHLSRINVHRGQYVSQNEVIGLMGNTGRSTGPHLHFSIIKNGQYVDPMAYLH